MEMGFIDIIRSWMLSEDGLGVLEYRIARMGPLMELEQDHWLGRFTTSIDGLIGRVSGRQSFAMSNISLSLLRTGFRICTIREKWERG